MRPAGPAPLGTKSRIATPPASYAVENTENLAPGRSGAQTIDPHADPAADAAADERKALLEYLWRSEWRAALKAAAKSLEGKREDRPNPSVRQRCGDPAPWGDAGGVVELFRCTKGEHQWVSVGGTIRCRAAAECPDCARMVAAQRAEVVERAVRRFERDTGGVVYLCSITVRHTLLDDPRELRSAVTSLWRRVWSGKGATLLQKRIGLEGYIRAVDVTYGPNGAHPHLHVLLFCQGELDGRDGRPRLREVEDWIYDRWARFCTKLKVGVPNRKRGVMINRSHVAAYITRMGLGDEVTKGIYKRANGANVTHWQALVRYVMAMGEVRAHGRAEDRETAGRYARIWNLHVKAMRGTRWLWWSKGAARFRFERKEQPHREALEQFAYGEWLTMTARQRAMVKFAAKAGFYDEGRPDESDARDGAAVGVGGAPDEREEGATSTGEGIGVAVEQGSTARLAGGGDGRREPGGAARRVLEHFGGVEPGGALRVPLVDLPEGPLLPFDVGPHPRARLRPEPRL